MPGMKKRFYTRSEAIKLLDVDEGFIATLSREEIIGFCSDEKGREELLSLEEMETIRVARTLLEDLDVNLPGVEVVMRMRQNMLDMRRQFDEILVCLMEEFSRILKKEAG
jgi:MerR family transcriptional regulator, heat shock protein HspR